MNSAAGAIAILGELASLEPVAFNLVAQLIHGLQGKSDAEVLATDASDLSAIIAAAHAAQTPPAQ